MNLRFIAQSRKAQICLSAIASIVLLRVLVRLGFSAVDADKITTGIIGLGGVWIASIAIEDHGTNLGESMGTGAVDAFKNGTPAAGGQASAEKNDQAGAS